jgi:hypothetical protein
VGAGRPLPERYDAARRQHALAVRPPDDRNELLEFIRALEPSTVGELTACASPEAAAAMDAFVERLLGLGGGADRDALRRAASETDAAELRKLVGGGAGGRAGRDCVRLALRVPACAPAPAAAGPRVFHRKPGRGRPRSCERGVLPVWAAAAPAGSLTPPFLPPTSASLLGASQLFWLMVVGWRLRAMEMQIELERALD